MPEPCLACRIRIMSMDHLEQRQLPENHNLDTSNTDLHELVLQRDVEVRHAVFDVKKLALTLIAPFAQIVPTPIEVPIQSIEPPANTDDLETTHAAYVRQAIQ